MTSTIPPICRVQKPLATFLKGVSGVKIELRYWIYARLLLLFSYASQQVVIV